MLLRHSPQEIFYKIFCDDNNEFTVKETIGFVKTGNVNFLAFFVVDAISRNSVHRYLKTQLNAEQR